MKEVESQILKGQGVLLRCSTWWIWVNHSVLPGMRPATWTFTVPRSELVYTDSQPQEPPQDLEPVVS